jgi:anti-anti-sigma factor
LEICKSSIAGGNNFELRGEVDLSTTDQLRQELVRVVGRGGDVRIDMRYVSFIGSCGVGVLLNMAALLKELGRTLVITEAGPPVERVLELLGAAHLLERQLLCS